MIKIGTLCLIVHGGVPWPPDVRCYLGRTCTVIGPPFKPDWSELAPYYMTDLDNLAAYEGVLRPIAPPGDEIVEHHEHRLEEVA